MVNIFQKLKKQPQEPITNQLNEIIEQKQYIEQKSIPLPEVKQEQINTNNINPNINSNSNINNNTTPIIPKNEMVKQLNEMNIKIDNLYEIVSKLTNLVQEIVTNNKNALETKETNDSSYEN